MTETMAILASLAPVFLVMALGYAAGRTKAFDNHNIGSLNALVMEFALPAALFTAMAQASRDAMIAQVQLALVLLGAMLAAYCVTYFVERAWFGSDRRESALVALTPPVQMSAPPGCPSLQRCFRNQRRSRSQLRSLSLPS
jgi:malonate transporter and related proteins